VKPTTPQGPDQVNVLLLSLEEILTLWKGWTSIIDETNSYAGKAQE
jgi:hypothetical protein